jgi:hypothetical protein
MRKKKRTTLGIYGPGFQGFLLSVGPAQPYWVSRSPSHTPALLPRLPWLSYWPCQEQCSGTLGIPRSRKRRALGLERGILKMNKIIAHFWHARLLCLAHVMLVRNLNHLQTFKNQILHKNLNFPFLLRNKKLWQHKTGIPVWRQFAGFE